MGRSDFRVALSLSHRGPRFFSPFVAAFCGDLNFGAFDWPRGGGSRIFRDGFISVERFLLSRVFGCLSLFGEGDGKWSFRNSGFSGISGVDDFCNLKVLFS